VVGARVGPAQLSPATSRKQPLQALGAPKKIEVARFHGTRPRRYLAGRLRNAADVPDLAQEIFLRLLRVEPYDLIRPPRLISSRSRHEENEERSRPVVREALPHFREGKRREAARVAKEFALPRERRD
jgi:hypothetical protein